MKRRSVSGAPSGRPGRWLQLVAALVFVLWLHEHYHLVAAPQALPPDAMAPTRGEQIFLREGCYGCHAVSEWPALPPPGPALTFARSKLSREFIYTWLTRPQAYRSELRTVSHFLRDDSETTARALTAFILQSSQAWARARAQPQAGGEATYAKIGCTACHGALNEGFANLGAKTNATWIAAYLRQPTAYDAQTTMPDFRLSAPDAEALAAALSAQNDGIFEVRFPHFTAQTAAALDAALSEEGISVGGSLADKESALGERRYAQARCGGCHTLGAPLPSGAAFADARDDMSATPETALAAMGQPGAHVQFALSPEEQRDLAAFVRRPPRVKLTPVEAGELTVRTLGCALCHDGDQALALRDESVRPGSLHAYLAKPDKTDKTRAMSFTTAPRYTLDDEALSDVASALGGVP